MAEQSIEHSSARARSEIDRPGKKRTPGSHQALALDARTEAWRFYHDNSLDTEPDAVDRAILKTAVRLVPAGMRVLDVGTGRGHLLAALRPEGGLGIDLSKRCIMDARDRYPGFRFVTADLLNLATVPSPGGPFDYIVLNQVLPELADLVAAFRALHAHVKPGTRVVVFDRTRPRVPRWAPPSVRISGPDLEHVFHLGGFEAIRFQKTGVFNGFRMVVLRPAPHLFEPPVQLTASVILPILSEVEEIPGLLESLPDLGDDSEYLLVTAASTHAGVKNAVEDMDGSRFRILNTGSENHEAAVFEGISAAACDCVVLLNGRIDDTPELIPSFLEALRTHEGDLILANRRIYPDEGGATLGTSSRLARRFLARLFTHRTGQRVGDVNNGLKAVRRGDMERIMQCWKAGRCPSGFHTPALLATAGRLHLKILDYPARPARPISGGKKSLLDQLRFFWRALFTR